MEQKSQKGIIVGALVVVVALGLIFFYAGRGGQEPSASIPTTADQTATVTPDDAPEKLSQDAELGLPDIEADLKEVDDALKSL